MRKPRRSAAAKRPTPRKPALALLRDPRLKKIYLRPIDLLQSLAL